VRRARLRWIIIVGVALGLLAVGARLLRPAEPPRVGATLAVAEALGGDPAGFARADAPRRFAFPEDHGPHPGYRLEWWYWTGNLATAEGRRFGFQLTFFRNALTPAPVVRTSAWGAHEVYLGHFALTDVADRRLHAFERVSRAALGLAGARAAPFAVWLETWSAEADGGGPVPPMRLRAAEDGVGIDLHLRSLKPVVLQGDAGLSRKSAEPGNASYYYSLTRMEARGTVTVGGRAHAVDGLAWMDREWSTSALGDDQVGWDWFALQLDDGREVMYYQLRRRDGTPDPASRGTLVGADGRASTLTPDDVDLAVLDRWRSPRDGRAYPARWRLAVPAAGLDVTITPLVADQELDLIVRYWEGAVAVGGTAGGRAVDGHGYVELTGYGDAGARRRGAD
jgi:predicted secreted hydrolase